MQQSPFKNFECSKQFAVLVLILAILLPGIRPISGEAHADPSPQSLRSSPVKIGVLLPLTGAFAQYGSKIRESIAGFSRPEISLIFEDDGCDPKMAVDAFKKLSERDGIRFFLGPACGSPQKAVAPLVKSKDSLVLLGNSAPEAVYELAGGRMLSAQSSIEAESSYLAERMNEFSIQSVIIVFGENQFSRAHEAAFRAHFKGKIIETIAYDSFSASEIKSISLRIKQRDPEALYVPDASPLMMGLLKELRTIGVKGKKTFSVYGTQLEGILKVMGADGEGLIYSYPDITEDALEFYPRRAAEMLTDAVLACGEAPACVKKLLYKHGFNEHGALAGKLILKTIRNGAFQRL